MLINLLCFIPLYERSGLGCNMLLTADLTVMLPPPPFLLEQLPPVMLEGSQRLPPRALERLLSRSMQSAVSVEEAVGRKDEQRRV